MDYRIRIENMAVGYTGKTVVNDINLSVRSGEIITLIGPNGSGKSTILKTISRQIEKKSGIIYLDETSLEKYTANALAKKLSVMMTDRIKTEMVSCYDIVATGRYPYTGRMGMLGEKDREKIEEAMKLTDVTELAELDFLRVSDGQRQRVMLAKALCQEPDIIVMDEPTSYLDIKHKLVLLYTLLKLVREKNITVIMSLHELELAEKISDRVICIKNGAIDKVGSVEEIFTEEYINSLYEISISSYDKLFKELRNLP